MPPVKLRDFSRGLWVNGPSDTTPPNALRRAKGVHRVGVGSLRSRDGSTKLYDLTAHSLARYNSIRFQGVSTSLHRDGSSVKSGLNGSRLTFLKMPPTIGKVDFLFVAGGGELFKVDQSGTVTKWGIVAPAADFSQADDGAGVLVGVYQYRVTFLNSASGHRSNANPNAVVTASLASRKILLSSIPTSTDAQVNAREVWRTVGNGSVFFKVSTIADNTTTTYADNAADTSLLPEQLPFDNDPPGANYNEVVGPHAGRAWWTRVNVGGEQGRVFYSPIGRPEAVDGFLDVTNEDDPTQRAVVWGGALWVFSKAHLFQVAGIDEPFVPREVFGVPGTVNPFTVVATPFGILYQATDGVRLFNGSQSVFVGYDALGQLFSGEAREGISAFAGVVAEFARDEYMISDTNATLALNLAKGTWRNLGVASNALLYEDDTKELIAAVGAKVLILEDEGLLADDGVGIAFEVEPASARVDADVPGLLRRVFIDVNAGGQTLTPSILVDGAATALATLSPSSRDVVEYTINRSGTLFGLRLAGTVSARVELFGVELDVYTPGEAG